MKVVILKIVWGGGVHGVILASIEIGEAYGSKNLDSYSSRAEVYDFFVRFEKFSFWGSGGGLKVRAVILKWDSR